MATITGLTADRMLAIEAASVVDGDVVGDNLILTTHGGTQINAGNVRGPEGPQGPVGQPVPVLTSIPVLEVGLAGQIRAGRQLTAADFTSMGLAAPLGLWNLSDLTDASGNGRNLLNKGGVALGIGINGLPNTAAKFVGSKQQALYISDTGAADPFRIKTGSYGCWFKTAKRSTTQPLVAKGGSVAGNYGFQLSILSNNHIFAQHTADGTSVVQPATSSDIGDDRWHFAVATDDGSELRIYVDGVMEVNLPITGAQFGSNGPLNIGSTFADASVDTTQPSFARIDEAFITGDVLSEDQIRVLYCARLPHTLGVAPTRAALNVRRRKRGSGLAVADFPTPPVRLHNFSGGSLGDEGSNGVALTNNAGVISLAGADGAANNAFSFDVPKSLSSNDTGMPSGLTPRSYGAWFKKNSAGTHTIMSWGSATGGPVLLVDSTGAITSINWGTDQIAGKYAQDGQWHHAVVVEDNGAIDGKRKLYLDGMLNVTSELMSAITLGGANCFRVGANFNDVWHFIGQIDGVFVCNYAFTPELIHKLFLKGSQTIAASPKNAGDHIEVMTATDILVAFEKLEGQHLVDLGVLA